MKKSKLKKLGVITLNIILVLNLTYLTVLMVLIKPGVAKAAETDVVINEFLPNPTGTDSPTNEWFELFNKGVTTIPLNGWTISEGTTIFVTFSSADSITPGGRIVVNSDNPPGNLMSNSGSHTLELENSAGVTINSAFYSETTAGSSYARKPDGSGAFVKDPTPTPNTANNTPSPAPSLTLPIDGLTTSNTTPIFDWSDVTDSDGDSVSYRIIIDSIDTLVPNSSFTPAAPLPEGQYFWKVAGWDGYEMGDYSAIRTLLIDTTPPTSTIATSGTFGPNTWSGAINGTANDNLSGVASVSLEVTNPSGQYWNGADWVVGSASVPASGTTNWSYVLSAGNLTQEGTYTITSKATDSAGNVETTGFGSFVWDGTPPSSDPSDFSSTPAINISTNNNTIQVNWTIDGTDTLSGVDGYSYFFTQGGSDTPDTIKDIEENINSVVSSALSPDGSWWFHIRTVDNAGNWTATAHYGPFIIDTTAPAPPATLSASVTDGNVTLSWETVSDADHYEIWRSSSPWVLIAVVPGSQNTYLDTDVERGKTYQYKIVAVDEAGNGSIGAFISILIPALSPTFVLPTVAQAAVGVSASPSPSESVSPSPSPSGTVGGEKDKEEGTETKGTNYKFLYWLIPILVILLILFLFWRRRRRGGDEEETINEEI